MVGTRWQERLWLLSLPVGTEVLGALALPHGSALPSHPAEGGISVPLCDGFVTFHKWLFTP